jgi:Type II secretion system (T2SS), protein G
MARGQMTRIFFIGAWVIWCASCLTIQVTAPPEPRQAIESDSEKVRRAIAELRTISTALQAHAVDFNSYPKPDTSDVPIGGRLFAYVNRLSSLPAEYRRSLATFDPWGFPYLYWTDGQRWVLICTGSDGRINDPDGIDQRIQATLSSAWNAPPQQTHCLEDEIIVLDARFLTWPANDTRNCSASRPPKASDSSF